MLEARTQRADVGLAHVALVGVALQDHLLDARGVEPEQSADETHRHHVLAAPVAARLLGDRAQRDLGGAGFVLGRDPHGLGIADQVPVVGQLLVVEVEGLLVEADQQVHHVALREHGLDTDPHLVHARAALDLSRVRAEGQRPVAGARRPRREDVATRDHAFAGLAGEAYRYVIPDQVSPQIQCGGGASPDPPPTVSAVHGRYCLAAIIDTVSPRNSLLLPSLTRFQARARASTMRNAFRPRPSRSRSSLAAGSRPVSSFTRSSRYATVCRWA